MTRASAFRPAFLLPLLLLAVPSPVRGAERTGVLLYRFQSATPAAPVPVTQLLGPLVRDELQKRGPYGVLLRDADDPVIRRAESDQPTREPTQLHHALSVARSLGVRYLVQGLITAYEPPQSDAPGKLTLRLTTASVTSETSRELFVTAEMKVSAKGTEAAKVLGPAARAVAIAIVSEAIPALDRAAPADRAQAAEQARARGADAAAAGVSGQAVQELQGAARLDPENAATHRDLGEALVKQGLLASALLKFREALTLESAAGPPAPPAASAAPQSPNGTGLTAEEQSALRLRLVRGLADRGLFDEAMAEARRGLEHEAGSVPLRLALAEAAVRSGDGPAALAALQPLHADRGPRNSEWNLLAAAYALSNEPARWLDSLVRGAVDGVPEGDQYEAVVRRLDIAFRALADEAEEGERRLLSGQLSVSSYGASVARLQEQTRVTVEYLGRLAFPDGGEAVHEARQVAWAGLLQAAEQGRRFADGGTFDDLAAARGERLRAVARLDSSRLR
jgi:tetratricopeptide (TPR) repeat protein